MHSDVCKTGANHPHKIGIVFDNENLIVSIATCTLLFNINSVYLRIVLGHSLSLKVSAWLLTSSSACSHYFLGHAKGLGYGSFGWG